MYRKIVYTRAQKKMKAMPKLLMLLREVSGLKMGFLLIRGRPVDGHWNWEKHFRKCFLPARKPVGPLGLVFWLRIMDPAALANEATVLAALIASAPHAVLSEAHPKSACELPVLAEVGTINAL